ncbi:MAG: stage V sporulation protein AD [Clostridia bacterium]|nr:stage V sporulation protein AD [Clostridia bacterium]
MNMQQGALKLDARILSRATAVGGKEADGPLGARFDFCDPDNRYGMKTWESAESEMQRVAFNTALAKCGLRDRDLDALFAGDLLNQCVGSAYGLLAFDVPYFGLYGACSTCAEGLLLASALVSGGLCERCGAVTSSHYCSAERQYRTPLEYGAQRPPTAQWTVTGAGAFVVGKGDRGAHITRGMAGKALERGVNDANNMGAAMAPAAADTLVRFFSATGTRPEDYSLIVTGDLGFEGGSILEDLMRIEGYPMGDCYTDCGQLIFDRKRQDVHGGGSGCGCSAVVLAAHLLPELEKGTWERILFLSTGAMMSPDSIKQGESIPAVAHLLEIERG